MKLTLIRHGLTEGNIRKLYYGREDLPLLSEGKLALEELKKHRKYPTAECYYTSGMLRTEQTLEAIYGKVEHKALSGLREIDFGDFEMHTYDELKDDPAYLEWITGDNEANVCPHGESGVQVTARAVDALLPLIRAGEDAVCITHGGVIGGVMVHFFPNGGGRYEFTPEPGYGFQIEFDGERAVASKKVPVL